MSFTKIKLASLLFFTGLLFAGCTEKESGTDLSSQGGSDYYLYISSGWPTASAVNIVTKWDSSGNYVGVVLDYATMTGFSPGTMLTTTLNGVPSFLSLAYNGTNGRIDAFSMAGTNSGSYIVDNTGLVAGARRFAITPDGGVVVPRTLATLGIERYNSARIRLTSGAVPRYVTSAMCPVTNIVAVAAGYTTTGVEVVLGANAAATTNNRISVWNGQTAVCGAAALQPATVPSTLMWPVDLNFISSGKILVLWYPFTASTTNAQIYQYDVTGTPPNVTIDNGVLAYDDGAGDIATPNATPHNLSSAITYYTHTNGTRYVFVATANNTILKFTHDPTSGVLTKVGTLPFIYNSGLIRSPSSIVVSNQ
jgi:hypothetical protein